MPELTPAEEQTVLLEAVAVYRGLGFSDAYIQTFVFGGADIDPASAAVSPLVPSALADAISAGGQPAVSVSADITPGFNMNTANGIVPLSATADIDPTIGFAVSADAITIDASAHPGVRYYVVEASAHQRISDAENGQRVAPVLELLVDGAVVHSAASGYIRDASDHEESSNHLAWRIAAAAATVQLRTRRDSTLSDPAPLQTGQISIEGRY